MIGKLLQIMILLALAIYFFLLLYFLKKKRLNLKYTLLWIASGLVMLVIALFPGVLRRIANLVGIQLPVNALFAICFFCVILILMSQTVIISKQNEQVKRITQRFAMLDKRVRDMEEQQKSKTR